MSGFFTSRSSRNRSLNEIKILSRKIARLEEEEAHIRRELADGCGCGRCTGAFRPDYCPPRWVDHDPNPFEFQDYCQTSTLGYMLSVLKFEADLADVMKCIKELTELRKMHYSNYRKIDPTRRASWRSSSRPPIDGPSWRPLF
jgi:hypothetical protein